MATIQEQLKYELLNAAEKLRHFNLPNQLVFQFERMAKEVEEPCVVAVVGRVKAGKSTFINALLGQDLAKVGTTETTATINYFRYGNPKPDRPVRCHWRGGGWEDKDRAFLDSLQGNDEETLRRADGIKYLEYQLPNAFLKQVTLVDTPGTMAAVDEHQDRTADFMNLQQQLRERHEQETQELGNTADAIVYLIGQVARASDQTLLDEFRHVTQGRSRAHNAIGIMAKIDLQPEIMKRRHDLAQKAADQLKDSLNTVIPISAGLKRTIDRLQGEERTLLNRLVVVMRQLPTAQLDKLLSNEDLFLDLETTVSEGEREALLDDLDDIPWTVFTTIARIAADSELSTVDIFDHLEELTGFKQLNLILEQHFFKRGDFLRSYRIVADARKLLTNIKYTHLDEFRRRQRENDAQLQRFITFIQQTDGNPDVARELKFFVKSHLSSKKNKRHHDLPSMLKELERSFALIFHDLEQYNEDFTSLQHLEEYPDLFSAQELDELRALFGMYGLDVKTRLAPSGGNVSAGYIDERQIFWRSSSISSRDAIRRAVATRAMERYALLYDELAMV